MMTSTFHLIAPLVSSTPRFYYVRTEHIPHHIRSLFGKTARVRYDPFDTTFLSSVGMPRNHEGLYDFNRYMIELCGILKHHGTQTPKLPLVVENSATLWLVPGVPPLSQQSKVEFGCTKNPLVDLLR